MFSAEDFSGSSVADLIEQLELTDRSLHKSSSQTSNGTQTQTTAHSELSTHHHTSKDTQSMSNTASKHERTQIHCLNGENIILISWF